MVAKKSSALQDDAAWQVVGVENAATNTGCKPQTGSRIVNTSNTSIDSVAIKTRTVATAVPGMHPLRQHPATAAASTTSAVTSHAAATTTVFAVCYGSNASSAEACAAEAVEVVDVAEVMAMRNDFILTQLPEIMPSPADDQFQRKLLSVMKVNSMSPEGAIAHNWSTTYVYVIPLVPSMSHPISSLYES